MRYLFLILIMCLAVPVSAQTIDPIVSLAQQGWGSWFAIDESGNLYDLENIGTPQWTVVGNIPDLAGTTESSPFVGLSFWTEDRYNCTPYSPCAITSTGEYYTGQGDGTWIHHGTVGDLSGHPPAGEFVSLSFSAWVGAITDLGELYIRHGQYPDWYFVGSIPADIGVVATEKKSIGGVKGLYR